MNKIEQMHLDAMIIKDLQAASKSAEITEQIAIEFMDWCRDNTVVDAAPKPYHRKLQIRMTTKELFQEFLKTKQ